MAASTAVTDFTPGAVAALSLGLRPRCSWPHRKHGLCTRRALRTSLIGDHLHRNACHDSSTAVRVHSFKRESVLACWPRRVATPSRALRDGVPDGAVDRRDTAEISRMLVELVKMETVVAVETRDTQVKALIQELQGRQEPLSSDALRGSWEVVWSEGTMAWRALVASFVQRVAGKCRAGQCFDTSTWTALNFAELFDKRITITAQGTFTPAEPTQNEASALSDMICPARFNVSIMEGALFSQTTDGGLNRRGLPISGPGTFEILYGDSNVRVFRSSGGLAVQVPSNWEPPREVTSS